MRNVSQKIAEILLIFLNYPLDLSRSLWTVLVNLGYCSKILQVNPRANALEHCANC